MHDSPLLILRDEVRALSKDEWKSTEAWLATLGAAGPALVGIVLPLDLPGRYGRRGELWGIELLRWLRWSAPESVRLIPVLAVAWQPLEMILRAKHELLLVSRGTWFARLPDVLKDSKGSPSFRDRFIQQVRTEPDKLKISQADLELLAGGMAGEAARLTHHDLANEGYSAWRLWAGYLQAVRNACDGSRGTKPARQMLAWAEKVEFPWLDDLKRRMRQPAFHQFQILRRTTAPPKYPEVKNAAEIVRDHAKGGPPPVLRILLIDDEFGRGLADVLLKIVFGNVGFTYALPDGSEKAYCAPEEAPGKERWTRFVCVKNALAAAHWLRFWKEVDTPGTSNRSYTDWLRRWAECIGRRTQGLKQADLEEVLTFPGEDNQPSLDAAGVRPAHAVTVILLDLRLSRQEPEASYSPDDFESLRFRNAVKELRPDLPVVILTASRQALNYVAAMTSGGHQDGWLTKEAPDVSVDDDNSSRSVHYLLSRLHVFSTLGEWYRMALEWDADQIGEFSTLWGRSDRGHLIENATNMATVLFREAIGDRCPPIERGIRFYGYVKSRVSNAPHKFLPKLIARMVAIGCLLHSADWSAGEPEWNLTAFQRLLPNGPDGKAKDEKEFSKEISVLFSRDLYLPGLKSAFNALLPLEYDWLLKQDFGTIGDKCKTLVNRSLDAARLGAGHP